MTAQRFLLIVAASDVDDTARLARQGPERVCFSQKPFLRTHARTNRVSFNGPAPGKVAPKGRSGQARWRRRFRLEVNG
jgi:hypothetical protein